MPKLDLFASQSDPVKSASLALPDIVVRAGQDAVSAYATKLHVIYSNAKNDQFASVGCSEAEQESRLCAIDLFLKNMCESIPELGRIGVVKRNTTVTLIH